ncbi:MAG: 30S ribosomal protein S12 methylthiotransferase RimO [Gammaproteobacteria bacterium]|nr:MAG: 30S ribosomal protein S12 methylthiotransferase RimO [Gammaproteobacteria bacterium]
MGYVALGCPKALVDSERLLGRLLAAGYATAPSHEEADVVVINTCGFIEAAREESLEAIEEALAANGRVVVTGCLGAEAEALRRRYPQLLAVTGPAQEEAVLGALARHLPAPGASAGHGPAGRALLTPRHYAYLKVAEGCRHRCTFCIIPRLRGPQRSRPLPELLAEARALAAAGVRELLVVAQDTGAYGTDLRPRTAFVEGRPVRAELRALVRELARLGLWVRLHYLYPYAHLDALVEDMVPDWGPEGGGLLPYLDLPLQHASAPILRAMRRPAAAERVLERLAAWRRARPELVVRSTFIVGFPGETEAHFEELLAFLREARLERVGCFTYSPVEGAAANALPGAVPEPVKEERRARLMALQAELSARRLQGLVGRRLRVLVDAVEEGRALGRTAGDAPEVDGVVRIQAGEGPLPAPGELVEVEVTGAEAHDLEARIPPRAGPAAAQGGAP